MRSACLDSSDEVAWRGLLLRSPASPVALFGWSVPLGSLMWAGGCCQRRRGFFGTLGRYHAVMGKEKLKICSRKSAV